MALQFESDSIMPALLIAFLSRVLALSTPRLLVIKASTRPAGAPLRATRPRTAIRPALGTAPQNGAALCVGPTSSLPHRLAAGVAPFVFWSGRGLIEGGEALKGRLDRSCRFKAMSEAAFRCRLRAGPDRSSKLKHHRKRQSIAPNRPLC